VWWWKQINENCNMPRTRPATAWCWLMATARVAAADQQVAAQITAAYIVSGDDQL
jgi:hypothetical protein